MSAVPAPPGRVRAGAERAYLYRIATNLVTDHHRRRTRLGARLRELLLAHEAAPPRAPEPGEGSELQAIFDRLPRRDAALLWLAYVDGHDHAEMAEILDVRPASVRVLLSRARAAGRPPANRKQGPPCVPTRPRALPRPRLPRLSRPSRPPTRASARWLSSWTAWPAARRRGRAWSTPWR
ncbi:sigma-70 family RNA polymerase sigma factor [Nannocystis pusilla]|uniref:Sigma-70 family RNA polymerase sigma factor n=1 Tax=Nannocystis pusilla TaxID=889268 RepID=A0A9X3ETX6_9BACT|nr:sigma-70 family RNA polymerase sigma factor [Nannocystis pusilla]MCY1009946.1 sigma-70 family RNA polymerase sigma factor [Nannocystis pusilla]